MALNVSKGNMYSWITHTWNTVKGECPHGCTYCYMHRWGKQKSVRFDESELKTDLNGIYPNGHNSRNFIFVGSSCDLFADDIPYEWIKKTIDHCQKHYRNGYLFQSKNPARIINFLPWMPSKSFICTTIESNRFYPEIMGTSPKPSERAGWMKKLKEDFETYITIEPVLDFDLEEMIATIKHCEPKQVNIGADSGNNNLPEPSKDKLLALIDELKKFTVINQKRNLTRLLK
jgi:DNA repair photolyase